MQSLWRSMMVVVVRMKTPPPRGNARSLSLWWMARYPDAVAAWQKAVFLSFETKIPKNDKATEARQPASAEQHMRLLTSTTRRRRLSEWRDSCYRHFLCHLYTTRTRRCRMRRCAGSNSSCCLCVFQTSAAAAAAAAAAVERARAISRIRCKKRSLLFIMMMLMIHSCRHPLSVTAFHDSAPDATNE